MAKGLNKKKVVKHIQDCINLYNSSEIDKSEWLPVIFTKNDKSYMLYGLSKQAYGSGLDLLLDYDELNSKYSSEGIGDGFQSLIAKIIEKYAKAPKAEIVERELSSWLTSMLTAPENQITHYMVVESIEIERSYFIGKVVLEPLSQERFETLLNQFCDHIGLNEVDSENEKEKIKQSLRQTSLPSFEPGEDKLSALISTTVSTRDVNHGQEMARERFREFIHFLRFLGNSVRPYDCGQSFGLRGEVEQGKITELTFLDGHGWAMANKMLSFPIEMGKINPNSIHLFQNILVKQPQTRTEMEDRLINAIVWVSKAIQDPSDSSKFLSCCIALESLLCRDVKETIGKTLSERFAFLLAEKKEDRVRIFKDMKKIYGIRSKIAHEGRPKKDKDLITYLPYVTYYAKASIFEVAHLLKKEGWTKFDQLKDYLDDFKFS